MERNFSLIIHPILGPPSILPLNDPRSITMCAVWSKVLDILGSAPGQMATIGFISLFKEGNVDLGSTAGAGLRRIFFDKLHRESPLLAYNKTIPDRDLVAYHTRIPWEGRWGDFNPRKHTVTFNSLVSLLKQLYVRQDSHLTRFLVGGPSYTGSVRPECFPV